MINKMAINREPLCDVLALPKASSLNPLIAKIADRGHEEPVWLQVVSTPGEAAS
jgi:hypothetical protein